MAAFKRTPIAKRPQPEDKARLKYYRSRRKDQYGASPFEKRTRKRKFGAFFSRSADIVLIIAIAACLLYSLGVSPNASVVSSSNLYHNASAYRKAAQASIGKLKNRSKITFDQNGVITDLKKQYPEIDQASVELPLFGQKPKIRLNIAAPAFWLQSASGKFVVGQNGVAIAKASDLPQITKLVSVEDQSGFAAAAGKQVLSLSEVSFIQTIINQCHYGKVPLAALILPARAQELDLRTTDQPYFVKFYLGGDANLQTGQFLAARHQFSQSGNRPTEYLDVRVSGKIYYK